MSAPARLGGVRLAPCCSGPGPRIEGREEAEGSPTRWAAGRCGPRSQRVRSLGGSARRLQAAERSLGPAPQGGLSWYSDGRPARGLSADAWSNRWENCGRRAETEHRDYSGADSLVYTGGRCVGLSRSPRNQREGARAGPFANLDPTTLTSGKPEESARHGNHRSGAAVLPGTPVKHTELKGSL